MTGLEKILKHIDDDASAAANAVIAEANNKANEITAAARAEGEKRRAEIAEQSKLDVQACLNRAESAATLQEKKMILDAKQQIINNVILSAKDSLLKYSNEEYFNIILKMVKKYALRQPGKIVFSKTDMERLPQQFDQELQTALLGMVGASLTISDNSKDIGGGFILIYGDMEVNCSFDALFFASRESLQDKVCERLFV